MYIWSIAGYFMAISFSNEIFIPVFYKLGINTTYEYLELRFGRKVRNATTIMFMVANVISTGVVIYAPATAISAVTGKLQFYPVNANMFQSRPRFFYFKFYYDP